MQLMCENLAFFIFVNTTSPLAKNYEVFMLQSPWVETENELILAGFRAKVEGTEYEGKFR